MTNPWASITFQDDTGTVQTGIAPLIVSASRATDIPAFQSEWFFDRLSRGYVRRENPFNHAVQFVSFARTRLFVFWSKNPRPLAERLDELDRRGLSYYFQFTLNDYEAEGLEPRVPPLAERLDTFRRLSERLGRERVIWRFDPLILAGGLTVADLAEKVERVGDHLAEAAGKLVFSFADVEKYPHVRRRLARRGVAWREFTDGERDELAGRIAALAAGWSLEAATCAETVDLMRFGLRHNRCVDDDLIRRVFPQDRELMEFLGGPAPSRTSGPVQGELFPLEPRRPSLKDQGQRQACGCIVSKDIGSYNTCGHRCLYCYACTAG